MISKKSSHTDFDKLRTLNKIWLFIALLLFLLVVWTQPSRAESDLDDNISRYSDDPIKKWDELGKDSPNISFIIVHSLSFTNPNNTENNYVNSVVVGPGSDVGDIYNIHHGNGSGSAEQQEEDEQSKEAR